MNKIPALKYESLDIVSLGATLSEWVIRTFKQLYIKTKIICCNFTIMLAEKNTLLLKTLI